ncbi:MAG: hypothetical protein P8X74_24180, partial [Reinekea sp.]
MFNHLRQFQFRLARPFVQLPGFRLTLYSGLDLGLALVHRDGVFDFRIKINFRLRVFDIGGTEQ